MASLWGDAFDIESTSSRVSKLKSVTVKKPKVVQEKSLASSKKLSIEERLNLIAAEVYRILGSYVENTIVLDSYDKFVSYVDACVTNGVVAIDTETDNSLDPLTCKLMGLCLYTPGQKHAYIPVNHTNLAGERISWQVTEEQIKEQLDRLRPNHVKNIFHNAKFDYQVIKCTCKCKLEIYWDTLVGARMLNENESAALKNQYISKIDPTIEHYDIEHLFKGVQYAVVPPALFALYAATDAFMTYQLYLYQLEQFNAPKNLWKNAFGKTLFDCFWNVEMPCVEVIAEMELTGVGIDFDYAKKLKDQGIYVGGISARQSTIDYALSHGIIDSGNIEITKDYVSQFDIIISALYPKLFIEWVEKYQDFFKAGAIITDTTGVKGSVLYKISSILRPDVELIGAHPMAGLEVSGIENSKPSIFEGANYLITPMPTNTPEAIETAREIGELLEFKNISVLTPEEHDEMIAFLSQLTHCIAVSLMCCKDSTHLAEYTGDSFRDLTRIANINENMWSELFMMNRTELLKQMDLFEKVFTKLHKAIENCDEDTIKEMMRLSTLRRKSFNKK